MTFTAAVTAGGNPVTTGSVTFKDNGVVLGTVAVNGSGVATFLSSSADLTTLVSAGNPVGTPRSITAVYIGTTQFAGSTSPAYSQTVTKDAATAVLTISTPSIQYSDRETYEVIVTGAAGGPPADGVNVKIGTQVMNGATPVPFVNMGGGTWKATLANHQLLETVPGQLNPNGMNKIVSATYSGATTELHARQPDVQDPECHKGRRAGHLHGTHNGFGGDRNAHRHDQDITADTGDPAWDNSGGNNIAKASVTFFNRATSQVIGVATMTPTDQLTGTASYTWNAPAGTYSVRMFRRRQLLRPATWRPTM